jgi:hypothetical protein
MYMLPDSERLYGLLSFSQLRLVVDPQVHTHTHHTSRRHRPQVLDETALSFEWPSTHYPLPFGYAHVLPLPFCVTLLVCEQNLDCAFHFSLVLQQVGPEPSGGIGSRVRNLFRGSSAQMKIGVESPVPCEQVAQVRHVIV